MNCMNYIYKKNWLKVCKILGMLFTHSSQQQLPWVSEAFLSRFPVLVEVSYLESSWRARNDPPDFS